MLLLWPKGLAVGVGIGSSHDGIIPVPNFPHCSCDFRENAGTGPLVFFWWYLVLPLGMLVSINGGAGKAEAHEHPPMAQSLKLF